MVGSMVVILVLHLSTGDGEPGGGGEYNVVDGFGWTNGVVLFLLEKWGGELQHGEG